MKPEGNVPVRTLLADPSKTVREYAKQILLGAGYQVVTAADRQEIQKHLSIQTPTVLLVDSFLAEAALPSILEQEQKGLLELIVAAEPERKEEREFKQQLGGKMILTKPYRRETILAEVALARARLKRHDHSLEESSEESKESDHPGQARREEDMDRKAPPYLQLLHNINEAVLIQDPQTGEILRANQAAKELLGRKPEEKLRGRSATIFVSTPPYSKEDFLRSVSQVKLKPTEWLFQSEDQKPIPVEISASILKAGRREWIVTILRNIGRHKQIAETLRRHGERLADRIRERTRQLDAVFSGTPASIFLVDRQSKIVQMNQIAARHFGQPTHELCGTSFETLIGCYHRGECNQTCFKNARQTGRLPIGLHDRRTENSDTATFSGKNRRNPKCLIRDAIEYALTTGNRVEGLEAIPLVRIEDSPVRRWFMINIEPVELEGSRHAVLAMMDITLQKKVEESFRTNQEHLKLALKAGNAYVFDFDLETNENRTQSNHWEGYGYPKGWKPQTIEEIIEYIHPEGRSVWRHKITNLSEGISSKFSSEARFRKSDGSYIWLWHLGRVETNDQDGHRHLIGISCDITKRKTAEKEQQQRIKEVERARAEAETAWNESNRLSQRLQNLLNTSESLRHEADVAKHRAEQLAIEAKQASTAKSDFLANMSHEIRTPVNGIIGTADLLMDSPLSQEQRDYVGTICHSAETLVAIVNDILDLSKIEAQKIELEYQSVNLEKMVEEIMNMFAPLAEKRHLGFYVRYTPKTPTTIVTDPIRLRQVLTNLLSNALKFTEEGWVLLEIESATPCGPHVPITFRVRDTGIGMTEDQQRAVFEKFTQADASTTRRFGGTGLGLSISRELVRLFNGELQVESVLAKGTTFSFTLDLPVTQENPNSEDSPKRSREKSETIVLAICNPMEREILAETCRGWGYQVLSPDQLSQDQESPIPMDWIVDQESFELDRNKWIAEYRPDKNSKVLCLTNYSKLSKLPQLITKPKIIYLARPITPLRLRRLLNESGSEERLLKKSKKHPPKPAPQFNLNLLLTEDRKINQKVASEILKCFGCKIDIANNGVEALEKVQKNDYDLIFMDCQMPIMDGYEATRQIRQLDGPAAKTSIIAMTANALSGDREKCLEAGMDEYISKPITKKRICKILEQFVEQRNTACKEPIQPKSCVDSPEEASTASPVEQPAKKRKRSKKKISLPEKVVLNRSQLEEATDGSLLLLEELIDAFLDETRKVGDELSKAFETADFQAIQRTAHGLKGESALLGGEHLSHLAQEMESAAARSDARRCKNLEPSFIEATLEFCDAIQAELSSNASR